MKLLGCSFSRWLCLVSIAVSSFVVVAVSAEEQEEAQRECIAPHALHECMNNLQVSEREWMSKVDAKERAVTDEWHQKLNLAVATAQNAQKETMAQKQAEWERVLKEQRVESERLLRGKQAEWELVLKERLEALESEYVNRIQVLSKEFQDKIVALEETVRAQQKTQEELKQVHATALQQEREEHEEAKVNAVRQAVQEADQKHSLGYSKLKHAKSLVDAELTELKSQVADLHHHKTRTTNDLLEARRALLEANEIVRLYNMKFYNRWFVVPVKSRATQFYDSVGQPLAKELYIVGQPVWDPLNEHVWEPILLPIIEGMWEQVQSMMDVAVDCMELAWNHVAATVPPLVESAIDKAWPHISKASNAVFHFALRVCRKASKIYAKDVHPTLDPLVYQPVGKFYTTKLVPFFQNEVVPNWNKHVVKNWKKTLPIIVAKGKSVQATLLLHWTQVGKTMHSMAREQNLLPAIQDVTRYMVEHAEVSFLKTQQAIATLLALLFLWRFVFAGSRAPKTPNPGKKPKPQPKKSTNGVQFIAPATPPNGGANNHSKKKQARKGTPHSKAQ